MTYSKPRVYELGTLTEATRFVAHGTNIKGGVEPRHIDKKCEWSGGSDIDHCAEVIVER